MALYVLKWIVGLIVIAAGVLFGLSIIIASSSSDIYKMGGAAMISISFLIVGINIFMMGSNEKKKDEEINKIKKLITKAEGLSSKKKIESFRTFR